MLLARKRLHRICNHYDRERDTKTQQTSMLRSIALSRCVCRPVRLGTRRLLNTGREVPHPPRLPREEQEEFEKLQRIANSQEAIDEYNESIKNDDSKESLNALREKLKNKNDIGGFSPEYSKTIPEFDGDVNPKTGEIGGPKQDPTKHGDWSFNGRVTDF